MKKLKKMAAMLLCLAMVFSLFFFLPDSVQRAEAVTSLPGIEEIKHSAGTFSILEIVPQAGSGSIGWYVDGQEPGVNWVRENLASLTSKDAREAAAADYLSSLQTAGLLGAADATPLRKTGDYREYAPWERDAGISYKTLVLDHTEERSVTGTFSSASGAIEYRANNSYSIHPGGAGGDFDLNIHALEPADSGGSDYYITLGAFTPLGAYEIPQNGLLVYQKADYVDTNGDSVMDAPYHIAILDGALVSPEYIAEHPAEVTYLSFYGSMGSTYLTGLNLLAEYYTAEYTIGEEYRPAGPTAPQQFVPQADGFVGSGDSDDWRGRGHFDAVTLSYTYVGAGSPVATHGYSPEPSGSPHTVYTNTVFYTGGFANNNWFLRHVFDWTSPEKAPAIKVKSLTPDGVLKSDVEEADLIVLSNGRGTAASGYAPASNDITPEVQAAIQAVAANVPVIVDNALRSRSDLNIGVLAGALAAGLAAHDVGRNIYSIDTALATSSFRDAISGDHTQSASPFHEVWYEINYENFLRRQDNPDAVTLPEIVTIATCVRYIVNYGGQRVISKKTDIRVLELQPGRGKHLNTTMVSGWTGIQAKRITIDTMSTSEFIGKIDDLVEKYDLVYIGADTEGFKMAGGKTSYNDPAMNGLIYSNIGDTWVTSEEYKLTGLLDRDYSTSTFTDRGITYNLIKASTEARTFRFSGNDLTAAKVTELQYFAEAGYPVVVADELLHGTTAVDAYSFRAVVKEAENGVLTAEALAVTGSIPTDATKSYQWYRVEDGREVALRDETNYFLDRNQEGTYYCKITISGQAAISNTADVSITTKPIYTEDPRSRTQGIYPAGDSSSPKYTITITREIRPNGRYNYSVSVSNNGSPITPSAYQWYYWEATQRPPGSGQWRQISGQNKSTIKNTTYTPCYCAVTINGIRYESPSINYNGSASAEYPYTLFHCAVTATVNPNNENEIILTASCSPQVGTGTTYAWYKANGSWESNNSSISRSSGSFYCRVTTYFSGIQCTATSSTYTIIPNGETKVITVNPGGTTASVPAVPATLKVNTATVDYNSQVYGFLESVCPLPNVFTESGTAQNRNALTQFLNLSKPKIVFADSGCYPTVYTGIGSHLVDEAGNKTRTLKYVFHIENETDVTPAETRYYCNLYMDMNADGRYKYPEEQLADIAITDSGGNAVRTGELKAGLTFTVTRTLPDDYVGIVPWKLEVVKVGQPRVHASVHNYTRIAPETADEKTTIKILQILNGNTIGTSLNLITNSTYLSYFDDVNDFNLVISIINMNTLNSNGPYSVTTKNVSTGAAVTVGPFDTRTALFEHYDMLILGFADCYGNLNEAAANAVVGFIDSGKTVLFTHDTTSRCNLPINDYRITSSSSWSRPSVAHGDYYWGYYFNTVLRSAVGLDRYGVTDPVLGRTSFQKVGESGIVAAGPLNLDTVVDGKSVEELVLEKGYSIAYKPVSGGSTADTVPEVQGVSRLELVTQNRGNYTASFPSSDSGYNTTLNGNYITRSVSQVNEGQITTYPFNLNTKGFASPNDIHAPLRNDETMTIADTHNQYYQLNMNSDDIVVWYCLAAGTDSLSSDNVYGYIPNDVMNNYYIYSIGNVTYSGAGHSGNSASADEAKLFINTMIAAYRTAAEPPTVEFVDPVTSEPIHDVFYVSDNNAGGSVLASDMEKMPEHAAIHFQVTDPSLGAKRITAAFSCGGDSFILPIYVKNGALSPINQDADGNPLPYSLSGGVTYYFYPSEELLALLARDGSLKLSLTVTSSLTLGQPATAEITLRKIGLFPLD